MGLRVKPAGDDRGSGASSGSKRSEWALADAAVRLAAQHDARCRAGVSRLLDDDRAVDDDGRAFAARIAMRVRVSRTIPEVVRIKDCDVGPVTFLQESTVPQFERLGGAAGHLVNRLLQRDE